MRLIDWYRSRYDGKVQGRAHDIALHEKYCRLQSLLQKAPTFATEEKRKAWLMRVTANRCKDSLRAAWRKRTQPLPDDLSYMPEEDAALIGYVMAMDEKYRVPLHLFYYEGYSLAEIAKLLKTKPATVGTWLSRGRAILKSKIGVDLDEE